MNHGSKMKSNPAAHSVSLSAAPNNVAGEPRKRVPHQVLIIQVVAIRAATRTQLFGGY